MTMTFEQMQEILARTTILTERNAESITRLESSVAQNSIDLRETRAIVEQNARDLRETRAIADSNARAIEATANETALLKEAERSLFASQQQLTVAMIGLADTVAECNQRMDRTQAEIRGLRVETRRILERWLGEPFTDDPDSTN
jgi:chromosome segregation ATPase